MNISLPVGEQETKSPNNLRQQDFGSENDNGYFVLQMLSDPSWAKVHNWFKTSNVCKIHKGLFSVMLKMEEKYGLSIYLILRSFAGISCSTGVTCRAGINDTDNELRESVGGR